MTSPEGLHSLFIIKKCLIQNSKIKVHQNLLKYMQINWIDIMNENDKNCQLKTNFQGCFSKEMHIFLMFEANENFLLEMQIFSLAPCCFFDAQFCLLAVQQGSSKVRDTKNVFCCILEM